MTIKSISSRLLALLIISLSKQALAAANFNISPTPGTILPTTYPIGGTTSAFYTITNLTQKNLSGYQLTGLQNNSAVSQNVSGSNCQRVINLGSGETCILQLDVSGDISTNITICRGSSCTSSLTPLAVRRPSILVVGSYNARDLLLGLSPSLGFKWSFPRSITLPVTAPTFEGAGRLTSATCPGKICLAGGEYNDVNNSRRPLLALSRDFGNNWRFPTSITNPVTTPSFGNNGGLSGISCSGLTCVAVGEYIDSSSVQRPLIALSVLESREDWRFPTSITNPVTTPAFSRGGQLRSASASGLAFVAVGEYIDSSSVQRPLLALSTISSRDDWRFPTSITDPVTNPSFSRGGRLRYNDCNGLTCIAVGEYVDSSSVQRPLLALSTITSRDDWRFPTSITNPVTNPSFSRGGVFHSSSCSGLTCIAVGEYIDNSGVTRPLLALSTVASRDDWRFPTSITNLVTNPSFGRDGRFRSASCNGLTCIAAGEYVDSSGVTRPLLALSTVASRDDWRFVESISDPELDPAFVDNGLLRTTTCYSSELCIVAGRYSSEKLQHPLLAITQDAGSTWSFPEDIINPVTIPVFSGSGEILGTSS